MSFREERIIKYLVVLTIILCRAAAVARDRQNRWPVRLYNRAKVNWPPQVLVKGLSVR